MKTKLRFPMDTYVFYLWIYFLIFTISEVQSFNLAIWVLAALCFVALKEYFSLLNIRLQDRWSLWGAYLAIPFMVYFIQVGWYEMFAISIPVYAFLITSFLVTIGGQERNGTVFSIGAINFGLFLFVYCIGHLGYLTRYSVWLAILLVLNVTVCDAFAYLLDLQKKFTWKKVLVAMPFTVFLTLTLSEWTGIPWKHSIILGLLIPPLVGMSRRTIMFIESDLQISREQLIPGKGEIIDNMKSYLFVSPIIFHYIRFYLT
jgi:phosphatidate cytidylyltransferase